MTDLDPPSLQGFLTFIFIDHGPAVFMICSGVALVTIVWRYWD